MGLRGLDKIILAPLIKSHLTKLCNAVFVLEVWFTAKGLKIITFCLLIGFLQNLIIIKITIT